MIWYQSWVAGMLFLSLISQVVNSLSAPVIMVCSYMIPKRRLPVIWIAWEGLSSLYVRVPTDGLR